ncbi:hypothetical protein L1S32_05650 [Methanogenium sp. S4BF]|uniref:hypothetical protein n=1 Tax=Methanogenium sp. S4BF TaxID=1789226 RepID=UPI0024161F0E|nr:hypothetical protein [Methanogenium sp. S4BF]WFN35585.1 hypothetical protein L1S32_05650 [Methanogenium sp. S4BF]
MRSVCYVYCILAAVFLVIFVCMPVSAAQGVTIGAGPGSGPGYGNDSAGPDNASLQERVTVREQVTVRTQECSPDEACNATRLRAMVAERNQVYQAGAEGTISPVQVAGGAVFAFRAAAPLTGGNAPDLIRLSEEINGSVRNAVQNEERIRSQNGFMVFLFGGDHTSADAMMQEVVQNRVRIAEMNRLIEGCGCDPETATLLREQVQAMEQEQARFESLANAEKAKRGLFGIFG